REKRSKGSKNPCLVALELKPAEHCEMKARLVKFGEIEVEGERYTHDVVIDGGKVRKRKKGPSKQFREKFGHTPLSAGEKIPWGGKQLIVGTGAHAASGDGRSPSGGETARDRNHRAAHMRSSCA